MPYWNIRIKFVDLLYAGNSKFKKLCKNSKLDSMKIYSVHTLDSI